MATVSPSSASESRSSGGSRTGGTGTRGQLSPTAALVAVAAIGMTMSLYATVFAGVVPVPDRTIAEPTLDRVQTVVVSAGVADPKRLAPAVDSAPEGYQLHVFLRVGDQRWTAGPSPPTEGAETASRAVAVRTGPGTVVSGRLRVVVWR
jgi:hypothetical protein